MSPPRRVLEAAAASLPTQPGEWVVPKAVLKAVGMDDPVAVQRMICHFALWARENVHKLPLAPDAELQATDFNDYYKIIMSRVQFVYAQANAQADYNRSSLLSSPVCCFQTQLRRAPTFRKGGVEVTLGIFDGADSSQRVGSFAEVRGEFRKQLAVVGARRFDEATLKLLIASASPNAHGLEDALAPVNVAWIRALTGRPLFDLLPDGGEFDGGDRVQLKVEQHGSQVVLLAQGPWFRVTFVETVVLQFMARFMTEFMWTHGDDGAEAWAREAMMMFAATANRVNDAVLRPRKGGVMFMSGRRAPYVDFHLLQVRFCLLYSPVACRCR